LRIVHGGRRKGRKLDQAKLIVVLIGCDFYCVYVYLLSSVCEYIYMCMYGICMYVCLFTYNYTQ
jgi:hypothetical protein